MGGLCCCPCGDDFDEYAFPANSIHRHCMCLRFFFQQLFSGVQYSSISHRLEGPASSPVQGNATLSSSGIGTTSPDSSLNDTYQPVSRQLPHDADQRSAYSSLNDSYHSVSRQLSYDADQRYSRLQRDGLVSRRDKSMTHFQEDSQLLGRNMSSLGVESLGSGKKWSEVESDEGCKILHSESSEKISGMKTAYGMTYIQPSSEDEDVCPTCLDEYTPENPKIMTQCSHHFHLGCIYEWMERSESCPICGKEMEFCESP